VTHLGNLKRPARRYDGRLLIGARPDGSCHALLPGDVGGALLPAPAGPRCEKKPYSTASANPEYWPVHMVLQPRLRGRSRSAAFPSGAPGHVTPFAV